MAEKAPYKLTVKLDSSRSDAIGEAMQSLRDIAGDYDQTGEASATITMESYCVHCSSSDDLAIDHIIALARGGTNDLENLQLLCRSCNSRKGAR